MGDQKREWRDRRRKHEVTEAARPAKRGTCQRCRRTMHMNFLNEEARIHHGDVLRCYDQRACERARRATRGRR